MIEKQISSKTLFDGSFLQFVEDQIEIENTEPLIQSKRQYVVHPGGVCIVPVLPNGDIVMVKQYRTPIGKIIYELPAGKIDKGEDTLTTAKRELKEETGYSSDEWTEIGETYSSPGYSTELLYIYIAKNIKEGANNPDPGEIIETVTMPLDEALQKIMNGEIRDAKTINGIFFYKRILES